MRQRALQLRKRQLNRKVRTFRQKPDLLFASTASIARRTAGLLSGLSMMTMSPGAVGIRNGTGAVDRPIKHGCAVRPVTRNAPRNVVGASGHPACGRGPGRRTAHGHSGESDRSAHHSHPRASAPRRARPCGRGGRQRDRVPTRVPFFLNRKPSRLIVRHSVGRLAGVRRASCNSASRSGCSQHVMPLDVGTTLGPYAVTAKIGEGGMGRVS